MTANKQKLSKSTNSLGSRSGRQVIFDGKKTRRLLSDPDKLSAFLNAEFDRLDADSSGKLSREELKPALLRIGALMQLPPPGTSQETDELVDGLFATFMSSNLGEEITRERFVAVCSDVLAGASAFLEEDPLYAAVFDGSPLQTLLHSPEELDELVDRMFRELDTDNSGQISARELRPALKRLGLEHGALPSSAGGVCSVSDQLLTDIIHKYARAGKDELGKDEFVRLVADSLKELSRQLGEQPLVLPQKVTVLNGMYLRKVLEDNDFFDSVNEAMFDDWDKRKQGTLSRADVEAGFRRLGLAFGLPPMSVAEAEKLYASLFLVADYDEDGVVDRTEFKHLLRSLFASAAEQLEKAPLVMESIVVDPTAQDGELIDGRRVLEIMKDEAACRRLVHSAFDRLDADGSGMLSRDELKPALLQLASLIGLPPPGTSEASDQLVNGIFAAVVSDDLQAELDRDAFEITLKKVLQGLADALHDNPMLLVKLDGQKLRSLLSNEAEVVALEQQVFSLLDKDNSGELTLTELEPAILSLSDDLGIPSKNTLQGSLMVAQYISRYSGGKSQMTRAQFSVFFRDVLRDLCKQLTEKPVYTQEDDKQVLNGSRLRKIMKNKKQFARVCEQVFDEWDRRQRHKLGRKDVRAGIRKLGSSLGLPPSSAIHAEEVYTALFNKADVDHSGFIEREEFHSFLRSLFLKIASELETKPVIIKTQGLVAVDDAGS